MSSSSNRAMGLFVGMMSVSRSYMSANTPPKPSGVGPPLWLVGTGASVDLYSMKDLPKGKKKCLKTLKEPYTLATANGPVPVDKCVEFPVTALNTKAKCVCLPDTVPALAVGPRCRDEGFDFHWKAYADAPTFTPPESSPVKCVIFGGRVLRTPTHASQQCMSCHK